MKTLSVIIPVYNERSTIQKILAAVERQSISKVSFEIIIIDDCSTDGTREILKELEKTGRYRIFLQEKNQGKGAAVRLGLSKSTGDFAIIQDADMEYNPEEYGTMIQPLLSGEADVVFGSRFAGGKPHRVLFFWHYVGNRTLTALSNMFTNLNLSDMETCYKAFTKQVLQKIVPELRSNRFGIEPEITARVAKHRFRIYEVGISYFGRTYEEGKKIGWKDGFSALWAIIRYNLFP